MGFWPSDFGTVTVSPPPDNEAVTLSASAEAGSSTCCSMCPLRRIRRLDWPSAPSLRSPVTTSSFPDSSTLMSSFFTAGIFISTTYASSVSRRSASGAQAWPDHCHP
jgi:hypothetical protein